MTEVRGADDAWRCHCNSPLPLLDAVQPAAMDGRFLIPATECFGKPRWEDCRAKHEKGPLARPFPDGSAKEKTGAYGFFGFWAGAAVLSAGAAAVWVFAPTSL